MKQNYLTPEDTLFMTAKSDVEVGVNNGIKLSYSSGEGDKCRPIQNIYIPEVVEKSSLSAKIDYVLGMSLGYKMIMDDTLNFLVKKFNELHPEANLNVRAAPLKTKERIMEKTNEDDQKNGLAGILDVVRASVVCDKVEDVFEFIRFTRNFDLANSKEFREYSSVTRGAVDNGLIGVPVANVFANNAFVCENGDKFGYGAEDLKHLFNTKKSYGSNYSDVKFYLGLPISNGGVGGAFQYYFLSEVLVTVKRFDDVYEATHEILNKQRELSLIKDKSKVATESEKEEARNLSNMLDDLLFDIHVEVKKLYNKEHKDGVNLALSKNKNYTEYKGYFENTFSADAKKQFEVVFNKMQEKISGKDKAVKKLLDAVWNKVKSVGERDSISQNARPITRARTSLLSMSTLQNIININSVR